MTQETHSHAYCCCRCNYDNYFERFVYHDTHFTYGVDICLSCMKICGWS